MSLFISPVSDRVKRCLFSCRLLLNKQELLNAGFARSRHTWKLTRIFLMNELMKQVYLEWLTRRWKRENNCKVPFLHKETSRLLMHFLFINVITVMCGIKVYMNICTQYTNLLIKLYWKPGRLWSYPMILFLLRIVNQKLDDWNNWKYFKIIS